MILDLWRRFITRLWPASEVDANSHVQQTKSGLKTRCPSCGYEGDETDFLQEDWGDTTCPKCGEDLPTYEI